MKDKETLNLKRLHESRGNYGRVLKVNNKMKQYCALKPVEHNRVL